MENTTLNTDMLLQELNDERAVTMIPVMVYLGILMISGAIGNTLVCYYYYCKSMRSSNTVFIVAVAVYDIMLCSLCIPLEMLDLRFFYLFTNSGACKLMRFMNYFAASGSSFTLLAISMDRYTKICRPYKKQLGIREAKIACGISVLVSMMFAWPTLIFYTPVGVEVETDDGIVLIGHDCTTIREDSYKIYVWTYNGCYMICFIIASIILCVTYGLVGRVLYKHSASWKTYAKRPVYAFSSSSEVTTLSNFETTKSINKKKQKVTVTPEPVATARKSVLNLKSSTNPSSTEHSQNHLNAKTVKFTIMMLVITLVFIISFLPHLTLMLWRVFMGEYDGEAFTDAGLVAFQIGLRSYFLNSATNPLIYGFFNPKFREFFYNRLCPCCRKSPENNTVSTSSCAT